MPNHDPLLEVQNLQVSFRLRDGRKLQAVDGIGFAVNAGEVVALVGESGCGKSVSALAILGLINSPDAIVSGQVLWQRKNLIGLSESELRPIRGRGIAMLFQNAVTSLNPLLRIGAHLQAVLKLHQGLQGEPAVKEALRLLESVLIADPRRVLNSFAAELSGGMCHRAALAIALACKPQLLIADEPTAGLDATIALQISELFRSIQKATGQSMLLISHDLNLVSRLADRVAVMYRGKIVERGPTDKLIRGPMHPYWQALLSASQIGAEPNSSVKLNVKENSASSETPSGCRYHPRCPQQTLQCTIDEPQLISIGDMAGGHSCACWLMTPETSK